MGGGLKSQDFQRNVQTKTVISRGLGNGFQTKKNTSLGGVQLYEYFLEQLKTQGDLLHKI